MCCKCYLTDATVRMAEMEVDVDEDVATGTRDVCVNSGITGDIELELEVLLESNNGKASEFIIFTTM